LSKRGHEGNGSSPAPEVGKVFLHAPPALISFGICLNYSDGGRNFYGRVQETIARVRFTEEESVQESCFSKLLFCNALP